MPLLVAPFFSVVFGLLLAHYGRAELVTADRNALGTRTLQIAIAFAVALLAPTLAYFAAFHGDWCYFYVVSQANVPSAIDFALLLIAVFLTPFTVVVASRWLAEKRGALVLRAAARDLAGLVVLLLLAHTRLSVSASTAQFRAGFGAVPIGKSPLGRGLLLAWMAIAGGLAWGRSLLARG